MSLTDHIKFLKVRDLREQYDPDEVNVMRMRSPRSEDLLHSPTRLKDHYKNDYVAALPTDEVVWELDLDEKVNFLTGNRGNRNLLVKNVKCEIELLNGGENA